MNYFRGNFSHSIKHDNSPVTEADIAANQHITAELASIAGNIPVIAEEDAIRSDNKLKTFFLVDPLDGTRSFIRGEDEFTVNIALISNGKPVMGIVYCPPQDVLYYGMAGDGAYKQSATGTPQKIHARKMNKENLTIVRSRSTPSKAAAEYLNTTKPAHTISMSGSAKFCLIAEGTADIYPRFGRTMEWDTAAGDAILQAAGGSVRTLDGKPLSYGKPHFENPFFIASGGL